MWWCGGGGRGEAGAVWGEGAEGWRELGRSVESVVRWWKREAWGMVLLCMEDPASKTARRCRGFAPLLGLAAIA